MIWWIKKEEEEIYIYIYLSTWFVDFSTMESQSTIRPWRTNGGYSTIQWHGLPRMLFLSVRLVLAGSCELGRGGGGYQCGRRKEGSFIRALYKGR